MALNVQPEGADCTSGDIQGQSKEQLRALNSYMEGSDEVVGGFMEEGSMEQA